MSPITKPTPTCQISWTENGERKTDGKPAVAIAHLYYRKNAEYPSLEIPICQDHYDQLDERKYDLDLGARSPAPVHVAVTYTALPIQISISPGSQTLAPGQTLQFYSTVSGTTNTTVTWSAAQGIIDQTGLYTAPTVSTATVDTITARSNANHCAWAMAQVSIAAPVTVTVVVSPSSANVTAGTGQITFTAVVNGITNQSVTWSASAGGLGQTGQPAAGSVNPTTGVYTPPGSLAVQSFDNVTATSVGYPAASSFSTVTINPNVQVTISPGSASVIIGGQQQFTATVTGVSNQTVTWQALLGSISPGGLYTAPGIGGTDKITATSTTVPGALAQVSIGVVSGTGVVVLVNPPGVTLNPGQTQQFTASVTGITNQAVVWSLQGPPLSPPPVGTISATGLYTAPASLATQSFDTVIATSVGDPAVSNPANVTINAGGVQQLDLVQWSVASQRTTQHLVGDPHAPYSVQMLDTDAGYPANYPKGMIWQIKNKLGNPWDGRRYDASFIYHWLTEDGDSVDTATCQALNGTSCWLYARAYKRFVNPLRGWPRYLTAGTTITIDSPGPNTTNRTTDCEATLSGVITLGDVRTVTSGPTKYTWGGSIDHGTGTGPNGPTLDSVNGVDTIVNLYYYSGSIAANDFRDREEYYFVLGFGEVAWYYYHRANATSPWVWQNQTVNSTLAATGSPAPNFPCGPGKSWFV